MMADRPLLIVIGLSLITSVCGTQATSVSADYHRKLEQEVQEHFKNRTVGHELTAVSVVDCSRR